MAGFRIGVGKSGSWATIRRRASRGVEEVRRRQIVAVKRAALLTVAEMKKGIAKGAPGGRAFAPLSPLTIASRKAGGTKPLRDTGALMGSITMTHDERSNSAFVGVHRTARGTAGENLVNVASVHEFGSRPFVVAVTPRIRALFWALHFKSGGRIKPISPSKTTIVHPGVPARPFVRPTLDVVRPRIERELRIAMQEKGGPL